MAEEARPHTAGDLWQVVSDQGKAITSLQTGVARLESRFDGGFAQLSAQLQAFSNRIEQVSRPTDVKGWIAVAISIALVLGSVGITTILPLREQANNNQSDVRELLKLASYAQGFREARSEDLSREMEAINRRLELLEVRGYDVR